MNKQELLKSITDSVSRKHPWKISQEKYIKLFGELPKEFLIERLAFDNLLTKAKQFNLCHLTLDTVNIEIKLTLHECILWELSLDKWQEAKLHNILPGDIKKLIKDKE